MRFNPPDLPEGTACYIRQRFLAVCDHTGKPFRGRPATVQCKARPSHNGEVTKVTGSTHKKNPTPPPFSRDHHCAQPLSRHSCIQDGSVCPAAPPTHEPSWRDLEAKGRHLTILCKQENYLYLAIRKYLADTGSQEPLRIAESHYY